VSSLTDHVQKRSFLEVARSGTRWTFVIEKSSLLMTRVWCGVVCKAFSVVPDFGLPRAAQFGRLASEKAEFAGNSGTMTIGDGQWRIRSPNQSLGMELSRTATMTEVAVYEAQICKCTGKKNETPGQIVIKPAIPLRFGPNHSAPSASGRVTSVSWGKNEFDFKWRRVRAHPIASCTSSRAPQLTRDRRPP
jgi:hypothetical protein